VLPKGKEKKEIKMLRRKKDKEEHRNKKQKRLK
jgi:hypothetical protein